MEDTGYHINSGAPSFPPLQWLSFSPFPPHVSPSTRRLSSHFTPPTRPVRPAGELAWVSIQGRIVGAEEASSAKAIGGGLSPEEAVAWELFSPMHRILIVAVIAVAAANSKKNKRIVRLTRSVEIRDQVLLGMQQKLDNLCEQVNSFKDKPDISTYNFEFSDCGRRPCDHHQCPSKYTQDDSPTKDADEDEVVEFKTQNDGEQEERRMSDLSDWAPSVSSSIDIQWNTRSIDQDICKLQKESEAKDATVEELSAFLNSAESFNSKRIAELEEIIRRKNMIITKLRKDAVVLERKVIHLTRLRRSSYSKSSSSSKKLPAMADNLVYDMDCTTSPSDDSDCSAKKNHRTPINEDEAKNKKDHHGAVLNRQKLARPSGSEPTVKSREPSLRRVSPLKEKSLNQEVNSVAGSRSKGSRSTNSRFSGAQKRWP